MPRPGLKVDRCLSAPERSMLAQMSGRGGVKVCDGENPVFLCQSDELDRRFPPQITRH